MRLQKRHFIVLATLAIGVAVIVGVVISMSGDGDKSTSLVQREAAPNFSIQTVSGPTFNLTEHRGKPVVLFFMAPGCPTCGKMLPVLAQAKQEFASQGLQVVGLNLLTQAYSPSDVLQYANSLGAGDLTWVQDENAAIARSYRIQALGETIVIDRRGYIAGRLLSAVPYRSLKEVLAASIKP